MNDECETEKPAGLFMVASGDAVSLWPWCSGTYGTFYRRGQCDDNTHIPWLWNYPDSCLATDAYLKVEHAQ